MECLVYNRCRRLVLHEREIVRLTLAILRRERRFGAVTVHLIGDSRMRELNKIHRAVPKTTDVLSFPTGSSPRAAQNQELGDIFISLPQIRRQAKTWNVSPREEFARMLAHGVLHLVGYDHIKPAEARQMFARQERYVRNTVC